jgi:hypothetical protein
MAFGRLQASRAPLPGAISIGEKKNHRENF